MIIVFLHLRLNLYWTDPSKAGTFCPIAGFPHSVFYYYEAALMPKYSSGKFVEELTHNRSVRALCHLPSVSRIADRGCRYFISS